MSYRYCLIALAALLLFSTPDAFAQASAGWQQRVQYEMDITLLADQHRMKGTQQLTYFNNSPDTLHRVFYHLYFNAFNPGSMMAERNRHLPDPDRRVVPRIFELGPDEVGYHQVHSLTQDGRPVRYRVNDTVMEVRLAEPIPPGGSSVFDMTFTSQVPLQTRRSGRDNHEGIDYSMSQWYPKMAAYDERGWHADPYVGREFYAPFGTFDVRITLPAHYVIGATGVLQNADQIGHGYQSDTTATYSYDPADSLTWHFHAEDVHDFAWAADPDYIHEQFTGEDGVTYHLLYQPDVAEAWKPMREWVPALIQFFSERYGPYSYPQYSAIQAGDGGMEYPMLTFITGRRSPMSLLGVTAHEAAHEWFYGILGSNEADYAWMDEGFTSYATTEAMAHVLGRPAPTHQRAHLNVLNLQHYGLFERLNTPSDWFTTNVAYGVASYAGGEMIADMLGYVISDSLRDAWFKTYYQRFKYRHPNPYDVEKVAEDVSGIRLDWFFEQFLNTTRTLDYVLADLDNRRVNGQWQATIELHRADDAVMPVDLRLTLADGSTQWVHVPLSIMEGHKPVPDDWIVAAPWQWTFPTYTLTLDLPQSVTDAQIDPLGRTPDKNRLNNASRTDIDAAFLRAPSQDWFSYQVGYRPLGQYANDFGVGVGLQARGTYLFGQNRAHGMVKFWPRVLFSDGTEPPFTEEEDDRSTFDGIDYELSYSDLAEIFSPPYGTAMLRLRKHLGVLENTLTFTKRVDRFAPLSDTEHRLTAALIHQYNPTSRVFRIDDFNWFSNEHMLSARFAYRMADDADWLEAGVEVGGSLRDVSAFGDDRQSAHLFYATGSKGLPLGRFELRGAFKFGVGAKNLALHKRFRLGAASVEDAWRNDAFRGISAAFDNALTEGHLAALQEPGPVAYLLHADEDAPASGVIGGTPVGTSMVAGQVTLSTFVCRHPWLRPLRAEAFSGIGTTWGRSSQDTRRFDGEHLVADAGLGLSYNVAALPVLRSLTAQSDVLRDLHLMARFPVWVSDPELIGPDEEAFDFRWLFGISISPGDLLR